MAGRKVGWRYRMLHRRSFTKPWCLSSPNSCPLSPYVSSATSQVRSRLSNRDAHVSYAQLSLRHRAAHILSYTIHLLTCLAGCVPVDGEPEQQVQALQKLWPELAPTAPTSAADVQLSLTDDAAASSPSQPPQPDNQAQSKQKTKTATPI